MRARSILSAATALGLCLAGGLVQARQDPRPTFRSGVNRVWLNVVVKDNRGRPVTGLVDSDFRIVDEGKIVPLIDFRSGDEPVSLAILVDTSGSMRIDRRLETARQAFDALLTQFRAGDEGALFTFDKALNEIVSFSTDVPSLRAGFARVDPFGSTSLNDAVAAVAARLAQRPSPRRAVVAITDGWDNSSALTAAAASGAASAIDVPVYVLSVVNITPSDDTSNIAVEPVHGGGVARLDELTAGTGGASFNADAPEETNRSVRQILSDLRTGYVLAFTPRDAPGWHRVTVRVAQKDARVRTRAGFWMGQPQDE